MCIELSERAILNEISRKLDRLIALQQIGLHKELDLLKREINKDKVSQKILEVADGSVSAGDLQKKVADITGMSVVTVKRRISELLDNGLLLHKREGLNIFYINSGIIEV